MDGGALGNQGVARMEAGTARPRVVILGAGFGGLSAAKALGNVPCDVVVIDRRNYHLFQPLLYQVATAALSPAEIASPIRSILSRQKNAHVLMARVTGIDAQRKLVQLEHGRDEPFDYLVVATGARHAYFGHDDWAKWAPGLKKIEDATDIVLKHRRSRRAERVLFERQVLEDIIALSVRLDPREAARFGQRHARFGDRVGSRQHPAPNSTRGIQANLDKTLQPGQHIHGRAAKLWKIE